MIKNSIPLSEYRCKTAPSEFPRYIRLGDSTMRLKNNIVQSGWSACNKVHKGFRYYRDNGQWGIDARIKNGKVLAIGHYKQVKHLNNKVCKRISKAEWAKENS